MAPLESSTSDGAGISDTGALADTVSSSRCGHGSAAASDVASDSTAASIAAHAGSGQSSAVAGMPDREDFQALSAVLKQVPSLHLILPI